MESENTEQQGMIITDDIALKPVLDFNAYSDTIVDLIKGSYPKFSIGIYGEWGTGKTTLMKQIESKLSIDKSIVTIWFNAWRYEREEQFALIPLLKKITYSLPDKKEFEGLKKSLKRGIGVIRRNLGQIVTSVVSDFVGQNVGESSQKMVQNIASELIPRLELLTEVNEKDTIYFDGIENIEKEIDNMRSGGHEIRIVVFIDDLDRCSPKKTLEVFESVKVFLGVEGFVYVIGLSHVTISKLITAEYGQSDIKGEQYIKKIIQIPITLPEWSTDDVTTLIGDFIEKGFINKKYAEIVAQNRGLIAKAIENNPREVKRFINNFIVAYEILSKFRKVDAKELLLVQAINVRWNSFYRLLVKSTPDLRMELKQYVEMSEADRNKEIEVDSSERNLNIGLKRFLRDFKMDLELWEFLQKHSESIFGIKNWETYRRAAESVSEYAKWRIPDTFTNMKDWMMKLSDLIDDLRAETSEIKEMNNANILGRKLQSLIPSGNQMSGVAFREFYYLLDDLEHSYRQVMTSLMAQKVQGKDIGWLELQFQYLKDTINELMKQMKIRNLIDGNTILDPGIVLKPSVVLYLD